MLQINYVVHKNAGVVVCAITTEDNHKYKGKARCCPDDTFDLKKGEKIAYTRAMIKLKKADMREMDNELKFSKEMAAY